MKFIFILLVQIIVATIAVNAQRVCSTSDENTTNSRSNATANSTTSATRDTLNNELIIIPVVVHILYKDGIQNISTSQVLSQIDALNKDFSRTNIDALNTPAVFAGLAADVKIKFCLARIDPQGRSTNGIIRKSTGTATFLADDAMKFSAAGGDNAWDSKRYLNIWVCKLFGRSLGYATYPGGPADRDGIVIAYDVFGTSGTVRAPFDKGRTATHEIGHWLGLKHTWGDANCGNDGVADTPPQQAYNSGCPGFPRISSCSVNANGDMFMNFMDFTDDACMNMFTQGQKSKMRSLFASGGQRNTFLLSNVCDSGKAEDAPLPLTAKLSPVELNIYPNPVLADIYIEMKQLDPLVSSSFRIFSSTGMEMLKGKLQKLKTKVNINDLPAGIYFVRVGEGKEAIIKKLIKL